jgi:hypothetical protein
VAVTGGLTRGLAKSQRKVSTTSTAITGTGAVTTGLTIIDVGSAQATVQNSSTAAVGASAGPAVATVSSLSAGTVNVVVIDLFTASIISAGSRNVGVLCTGQ